MGKYRKEAEQALQAFCTMLDNIGFKYDVNDEELVVNLITVGDNLPMEMVIRFDEEIGRMFLISEMPVVMNEDKRIDAAVVINAYNNGKMMGVFDLDIANGTIYYRITQCFVGCEISDVLCNLLLQLAVKAIDDYNDKFLMLNKSVITMEQMLSMMESE